MFYENVFDNSFLVNKDHMINSQYDPHFVNEDHMKVKEERLFFFFIYLSLLHPLSLVLRSLTLKKL